MTTEKAGETEGEAATVAETEATEMMEKMATEMYNWQKMVALVQAAFQERQL